jgi:hypothetical protein
MQAARRATECFQQALASSTRVLIRNRRGTGPKRNGSRRNHAGDSNEGRGRQLAREIEPWFILVSILSTPQAKFHARGLAGRLTRPAEAGGSNVSLAGLRVTGHRIVSRRACAGLANQSARHPRRRGIVLAGRMKSVPVFALA